jgi:hypothetical protein
MLPGAVHHVLPGVRAHHGAIALAVRRREDRPEYYQPGQGEGPEAQIFSERAEAAFRTLG